MVLVLVVQAQDLQPISLTIRVLVSLPGTYSWNNLEAEVTMAHIHGPAAAGASGPPLITLDTTSNNPASGSARLSSQQIDYLFAEQLYINIHTTAHLNGEIRGQILSQTASQSVIGTLQSNQWGAFVLRGNPQGITIEQMFSGKAALDLRAENFKVNWNVYTFNISTQSFDQLELSDSIQQGQAFWMIQSAFDSHEIVVENLLPHADLKPLPGCSSAHGCVSVPIADQARTNGWAFAGSPYLSGNGDNVVEIADLAVSVTNGPESCQSSCTFSTAIDANLVGDTLYVYDTAGGG